MKNQPVKKEDVNGVLIHFLELKDEQYLLNLTLEKANELGISKVDYENALNEVKETNSHILRLKKEEPNATYSLSDPQKLDEKGLKQTMPSGYLSTVGQEQVSTSFFAPNGTTQVHFNCSGGGALIPVYLCRTEAFGSVHSKTDWGSFLTWTDIYVPLGASNTTASIWFSTSDSNGGKCNWKAMM